MRALSASQLLDVWECGFGRPAAEQALALLAAACPEVSLEDLSRLSVGRRNARLLALREWTFGSRLEALIACPACAEQLELDLQTADLCGGEAEMEGTGSLSLETAGYSFRFRLPDSTDLVGADAMDPGTLRNHLLARCLLSIRRGSEEISLAQLPEAAIHAVAEKMAQADPQADITFLVACPACGHAWQAIFDIVTFFGCEITAWSHRILNEVNLLASAFGWSEADILAMSPWRRQCYLEIIGT